MARAIVMGNFDGVHLGHQSLFTHARSIADTVIALTFEPHPKDFFAKTSIIPRITPPSLKTALLKTFADDVVVLPFNEALSSLSAEAFLHTYVLPLMPTDVVVGEDFCFGKNRQGTPQFLRLYPFTTHALPPLMDSLGVISSSRVRDALKLGDISSAWALLGRFPIVEGVVQDGDKRGRTLGYPTANLHLSTPSPFRYGIYAVEVLLQGKIHHGVASFGLRPHFSGTDVRFEVFLFDFSDDIYGQSLHVRLIAFLRDEARFDSLEALKEQMQKDVVNAKNHLSMLESVTGIA